MLVAEIVAAVFPANELSVVQGGVAAASHLLSLPFNHIYFTGSPEVGKIVMRAAAEHPCSVTLELGGKSPVIVDESAPLKATAKKIAWAKLSNAGQICVAPDYIFVPRAMETEFAEAVKNAMTELYPGIVAENPDYQRIVKDVHAERLLALIDDAVSKGATVAHGGPSDAEACLVHPTILSDLSPDSKIMEEEVFGPVLPIIPYDDVDEAVKAINSRPIPLALYIYSQRSHFVSHLLNSIQSGGASINNSVIHVSSNHLPFGGQGNSGIGSGHGEYGFREFTHMRGVYEQRVDGAASFLMPPYTAWKTKLIDRLLRWL
jgi:aldehyde dehydrogenase (NAD+)